MCPEFMSAESKCGNWAELNWNWLMKRVIRDQKAPTSSGGLPLLNGKLREGHFHGREDQGWSFGVFIYI